MSQKANKILEKYSKMNPEHYERKNKKYWKKIKKNIVTLIKGYVERFSAEKFLNKMKKLGDFNKERLSKFSKGHFKAFQVADDEYDRIIDVLRDCLGKLDVSERE